jgi:hypothetical protein
LPGAVAKAQPYIGPTGSGDVHSLAIALQQFISRKYGTSVDLHMAASVSRAQKISHLKRSTRKLEDLHA